MRSRSSLGETLELPSPVARGPPNHSSYPQLVAWIGLGFKMLVLVGETAQPPNFTIRMVRRCVCGFPSTHNIRINSFHFLFCEYALWGLKGAKEPTPKSIWEVPPNFFTPTKPMARSSPRVPPRPPLAPPPAACASASLSTWALIKAPGNAEGNAKGVAQNPKKKPGEHQNRWMGVHPPQNAGHMGARNERPWANRRCWPLVQFAKVPFLYMFLSHSQNAVETTKRVNVGPGHWTC